MVSRAVRSHVRRMTASSRLARSLRQSGLVALTLLAACGSDSTSPATPVTPVTPVTPTPGTLAVSATPSAVSIAQGQSSTVALSITRGGSFSGAVDLVVDGAPTGVTTTLSTASIAAGSTSANLAVQVAATRAVGAVTLTVRARGTGVTEATATVTVTVTEAPVTPPTGGITLTRSGGMSITQGQSGTATVTLARSGGFTGAVDLSVEGIPNGVTATVSPTSLTGSTVTATVTVTASSSAGVGTDGVTIRARGTGVADATVLVPVTITAAPAGSFSLAVSAATTTIAPGQSGSVTITVNRLNGFTGTVALTTAAPSGVTATFQPSSVTGTSSVLTLAVASTVAPGNYTIGIGGTATGAPSASAQLTLTVSTPPSGGNIAWTYCGTERPTFFAIQDGTGAWSRVSAGTDGVFRFDITQTRGAVATVQSNGTANTLNVYHLTRDEIVTYGQQFCDDPGARTLSGTIAGAASTDLVFVGFGNRSASVVPSQSTAWTLSNVQGGTRDLLGSRSAFSLSGLSVTYTLSQMILRRGISVTGTASQPVLDFAGSEAFTPASANLTLTNGGGEFISLITQFTTRAGTTASLAIDASPTSSTARTWRGVPSTRVQSGDFHTLIASATPSLQSSLTGRQVTLYAAAATDRTMTFGPALGAVSTASVSGGGMIRLRSQYTIQSQYDRFYTVQYQQTANGRINQLHVSRGYLQNASAYDVSIPDLSGVSGWQSTFGLASGVGVTWTFSAQGWTGGTSLTNYGDGNVVLSATTGGQITP
ncbi:MAG: hypothetical protein RLZZ621_2047 [Gemmatimonadota bacterium]